MVTTFRRWGGWSIGLWLLIGQGAIVNPHSAQAASADVSTANLNLSATTDGLTQVARPVEITDIQITETAAGFTLQLETNGELGTPETSVTGNAVIANIFNAVLQLPDGDEFLANNLADGIVLVNVTNLPDNRVQIAITGTDTAPTLEISTTVAGLTVSVTPGDPTVQTPDDDSLRIVVTGEGDDDDYFVPNASTATRTDTPILDIPASIQVIPRQVFEEQQVVRLEEALTNVSGVTAGNTLSGNTETFNIRGFNDTRVLQNGFRQFGGFGPNITETANLEQVCEFRKLWPERFRKLWPLTTVSFLA